ncbi:MAG: transposase [Agarilytica sp.]
MARKPRLYLEGCAQHVIQRGNNRDVCFYAEADYAFYLDALKDASIKYGVAVHAFVLMTNHVHMLVTPADRCGVSKMMQALGRDYVRYINITYKRTGSLWEGRFKSCLVNSDRYFLTVSRYIELNPLRAGMVNHPGEYPWSSYRYSGMGIKIKLIQPHMCYLDLGKTGASRVLAYRKLFDNELNKEELGDIRLSTQKEWVIGSKKFRDQIEVALQRKNTSWGGR